MNFNNFTIKSQEAIQKAVDYVTRNGGQSIEAVHLLRGVIDVGDSLMDFVFQKMGVNKASLIQWLDRSIAGQPGVSGGGTHLGPERNAGLPGARR